MGFFDRESTVARPGFSRWLVPPAALAVHLSIGQVYAFSVFKLPLTKAIGITSSAPNDWRKLSWLGFSASPFFFSALLPRFWDGGWSGSAKSSLCDLPFVRRYSLLLHSTLRSQRQCDLFCYRLCRNSQHVWRRLRYDSGLPEGFVWHHSGGCHSWAAAHGLVGGRNSRASLGKLHPTVFEGSRSRRGGPLRSNDVSDGWVAGRRVDLQSLRPAGGGEHYSKGSPKV
jgi:hypothetical protein